MAKRFGGFTPEQMGKIIPEMQGMQADEQAKFLASQLQTRQKYRGSKFFEGF